MMKLLFSCLLLVLLGAIALPPGVAAQSPQKQDEATIRIATELLQLEVIVTDNNGKPVRDLQQADFELKEDGKPQAISYFSSGTSTRPARWLTANPKEPSSSSNPPATAQSKRYIVLVIDDLHLSPQSLMFARQALLKFIEQQLTADEQVALITTSGQLWVYQQFTNKREILKRAINRLAAAERRSTSIQADIPRLTAYQAELIQNRDRDALQLAVNEILRNMPDISPDMAASMASGKAQQIAAENSFEAKATLATLEDVVRSVRVLPGRKSVILLSDGFFLGGSQASNYYDLRQITDAATRAGMMIYALDARGLVTSAADVSQPGFGNEQPPGARARMEATGIEARRDALNALARDTGGFPIFNNNDLYLGLQKFVADTEAYYLLAFEPVASYRDGRFRKLEVRVKDHPEYTVRASRGYFAPNDKALAKKDAAPKMGMARNTFGSLIPARDIPMEMAVDFVDSGAGQSFATITAHLDISGVKFEKLNERYNTALDITGAIYDEEGKPMDRFKRKLALTLKPATYERMLKSGFVFDCLVKLKPGFYQVRMAAAKENASQSGSVSEWVEIGDLSKKELVLSSIFLAAEGESLNITPPQMEPVEVEKKSDEMQATTIPSQIARRFKRGAKFDYLLFAYNAQSDATGAIDLVVQTQLYSGNKVVYATPLSKMPLPPDKKTALPYLARLTLDQFEPGTYELRVLVIDHNTKTSAKRSLNFVVEP
jgi:VWFA-related protein